MKSETGILMAQINQMTTRAIDKLIAESGTNDFSAAQGRILAILWDEDGISMQELANRSGLAQNTLTGMIDRITKNGLCERRPDPDDRRKYRICLSEKGRNLRLVFETVTEKMYSLYFNGFDDAEIKQLDVLLHRIINNLQKGL
ncbi:MarR family winged helix-turn-helix transcriptional regulator [Enterocloster clostridioformis]|uniref:HTH marR-type domain-containing protein n=1 Tax=[Clostridium] clostridioforme 90A8 TaxID=999408 RepID=A0A0E2H8T9_9FIRM|nr:MarR family transcriptional regulator [Enterocloster clostridioformis]ENZ13290.1 hypothetical protein HMPREF1090_03023 [[Clostridium] clostridioforme 90A8]